MFVLRCVFKKDVNSSGVKLKWFMPRSKSPRLSVAAIDGAHFTICTAIYHFKRLHQYRLNADGSVAEGYVHLTPDELNSFKFRLDWQPKTIGKFDGQYKYDYNFPGHYDCISEYESEIIEQDAIPGHLSILLKELQQYVNNKGLFIKHENIQELNGAECML